MNAKLVCYNMPFLDRSVVTVIGVSEKEALLEFERFANEHNSDISGMEMCGDAKGWCQSHAGDVFIWVKDYNNSSTLIHEFVHAAFALCDMAGIGINEEVIARLVGEMKVNILDEIYHNAKQKK